ncbi:MAG TPA: protein kinase [Holophagaceae bacterium]|nr:protein kinase [Holophagaceae bacterium]
MDNPTPPQRLGRFDIIRPLGEGGMGQVYLAKDPTMGREVALKTITSERVQSSKARDRFLQEAKAAGTLSHPNLITVHEFGEDQGVLYLVMEYLSGQDLSVFLKARSLKPQEALELMAQVCDGLAHAHAKGILHRDVKPSNVRVLRRENGQLQAKLMDFGVAHLPDSKLTATGDIVGTYAYMAPEYLRGGEAGLQADLYPVGMMLFEALTGDLPQMGPTLPHGMPGRRRQEPGTHPAAHLSPAVLALLDKALAAEPSKRFPSAQAMALALRAAIPQAEVFPDIASVPDRPAEPRPLTIIRTAEPEPASRWPWFLAGAVVLAGLGLWRGLDRGTGAAPQSTAPAPIAASRPSPPAPAPVQPPQGPPAAQAQPPQAKPDSPPQPQTGAAAAASPEPPRGDAAFVHTQAEAFAAAYRSQRWQDMTDALDALQKQGVEGSRFGQELEVREVMAANRASRLIPGDLMERIRAYLPPPPGGGPQTQPGGGPPPGPGGH